MLKEDFLYHITQELVAQNPLDKRDESRLLVCSGKNKSIEDKFFYELPKIIYEKFALDGKNTRALIILNDSRVYPARVRIMRKTGARGEVFLLETGDKTSYKCLLRPQSKLKVGEILFADTSETSHITSVPLFKVTSLEPPGVSLIPSESLESILEKYGEMPLPPYIDRDPKRVKNKKNFDSERYQTVYSDLNRIGSAAAPTAGLHFTEKTITDCIALGIEFASVTLHVGLGTFSPVQVDAIEDHNMHEEYYCVSKKTTDKICEYLTNDWPIIYVGTTALRTVESFFRKYCITQNEIKQRAKKGELTNIFTPGIDVWHSTQLFLYPLSKHHKIKPFVGDALVTNFHQPESTLIMLIAALMGYDFWKEFYEYAMEKKYRFFSYGDSSLLIF